MPPDMIADRLTKASKFGGIEPEFDLAFHEPGETKYFLSPEFKSTRLYNFVREVRDGYTLFIIEALSTVCPDLQDDKLVPQLYDFLEYWLAGKPVLIAHYLIKRQRDKEGQPLPPTADSIGGRKRWQDLAQSVLFFRPVNDKKSELIHCGAQNGQLADPIPVFVDPVTGYMKHWDEYKEESATDTLIRYEEQAKAKFKDFDQMNKEAKVKVMMSVTGKSRSHIYGLYSDQSKSGSINLDMSQVPDK